MENLFTNQRGIQSSGLSLKKELMNKVEEYDHVIEVITPEKAAEYLKHSNLNRPLDESRISLYSRQMLAGEWRENKSEPISFAIDGTLLNGHHRLQAVIRAGIPVRMAVVRGVDPNEFEVIDTGKARTAGNVLAICGVKHYNAIAAMIKCEYNIKQRHLVNNGMSNRIKMGLTNKKVLDEYNSSPDLYQDLYGLSTRIYKAGRYLAKSEAGGIAAYLVKERHHDIEKVKAFFDEIATGGKYQVLSYLRSKLILSVISKKPKDFLTLQAKRVLISKAWNLYIRDEDQSKVIYRQGDKYNFD